MDIKDELEEMLSALQNYSSESRKIYTDESSKPTQKPTISTPFNNPAPKPAVNPVDKMSVDDILNAVTKDSKQLQEKTVTDNNVNNSIPDDLLKIIENTGKIYTSDTTEISTDNTSAQLNDIPSHFTEDTTYNASSASDTSSYDDYSDDYSDDTPYGDSKYNINAYDESDDYVYDKSQYNSDSYEQTDNYDEDDYGSDFSSDSQQPDKKETKAENLNSDINPIPQKTHKKIVISTPLPDYDAIRQHDLEEAEQNKLKSNVNLQKETDDDECDFTITPDDATSSEPFNDNSDESLQNENSSEGSDTQDEINTKETTIDSDNSNSVEQKTGFLGKLKNSLFSKTKSDSQMPEASEKSPSPDADLSLTIDSTQETQLQDTSDSSENDTEAATSESDFTASNSDDFPHITTDNSEKATISTPQETPSASVNDFLTDTIPTAADIIKSVISQQPQTDNDIQENTKDSDITKLSSQSENKASDANDISESQEKNINIDVKTDDKKQSHVVSALKEILNESPESIAYEKDLPVEEEINVSVKKKGGFKKGVYAFFGVIFFVFAIVGFTFSVGQGIKYVRSFTIGNDKKSELTDTVYPAVIMDIEAFKSPSELSSEQIINASIWSLIMSDDINKYSKTFDIISVPAVDIEKYAANLFGDSLPPLKHQTVGSGDVKFYYNEQTKSYNIPTNPTMFSYKPKVSAVSKNGNIFTVEVQYIKEMPHWMEKSSDKFNSVSKVVKFKLEKNNDKYIIDSMEIVKINEVA